MPLLPLLPRVYCVQVTLFLRAKGREGPALRRYPAAFVVVVSVRLFQTT